MPDENLAPLTDRVTRIAVDPCERIAENRNVLLESDAVLEKVGGSFLWIPDEMHGHTASGCHRPRSLNASTRELAAPTSRWTGPTLLSRRLLVRIAPSRVVSIAASLTLALIIGWILGSRPPAVAGVKEFFAGKKSGHEVQQIAGSGLAGPGLRPPP